MSALSETQAYYSPATLVALVRDFDREPRLNRQRISEFLHAEPEVFYMTAIDILRKDLDSRAAQYLVALLIYASLLFRTLCDPALDRERATELARLAQRGDPTTDVKLARELADGDVAGSVLNQGMAERLLEIVDRISDGKRILPFLMQMLRNTNPFVRSKVVLMIGRSGQSLSWLEKRLQESDTRVRANAVEGVWGVDTPEARELLRCATKDSNNRVAGNALVGLYRLGEIAPLAEIVRMAAHDSAIFRRTAAWLMGEIGDPRFSEILGRMIADSNAHVRRNAFTAVRRVREATAGLSRAPRWLMAITPGPRDPRTGERCVSVAALTEDGRRNPQILPVQFHLSEDGTTIWSYRVAERMPPGPMSVLFLFPQAAAGTGSTWKHGPLDCLRWKRSTDLWESVPYSSDNDAEGPAEFELPGFVADATRKAVAFQEKPKQKDCTGFWTAVRRQVLSDNATPHAKRHIIIVAPEGSEGPADDSLIAAVHESRTSVQVIATAPNPALQEFCRLIDGHFQIVKDASGFQEAVSLGYLSLLARYEIHYPSPSADATGLKVRIHTPAGWGEMTVDL